MTITRHSETPLCISAAESKMTRYEQIEDQLLSWDRNEIFYRDFYLCMKEGRSTGELLSEDVPEEWKSWVLDPSSIDPDKTEKDFFLEGRNVSVKKHPRYFPYFEHHHTFFEMIYVLSGNCKETTQGSTVILEKGDLFVLAPSVTHGIEVMDDSVVINILIRHSTFMDMFLHTVRDKSALALFFLGNLFEKDKTPYLLFHTGSDEQIREYVLEMAAEQQEEDIYADKIICAQLTIMFHQLTRRFSCTMETPGIKKEKQEWHDRMLQYIMDNYQTVTLQDLSDTFHFSVPYCSRMVREISGSSFQDLVTRIRLQQGENLLSHTQMNVGDISERVGYKNPETFIRAFIRYYQMSPSQYRRSSLLTGMQ